MMSDLGSETGSGVEPREAALHYIGKNERNELDDAVIRDAIARHEVQKRAFDVTQQRMIDEFTNGAGNMNTALIFKYCGTEEEKRKFELLLKIMGEQSLGWNDKQHFSEQELSTTLEWMGSKTHTIAGGTTEIQLNIIAKRALNLPGVLS
jgi:alkylation response protein AidB-like acyl-CoA dehydrogenase